MKFATKITALQHQPWSQYYLDYNGLKRILAETYLEDEEDCFNNNKPVSLLTKTRFQNEVATSQTFLRALFEEAQKVALFDIKEEGTVSAELEECQKELHDLMRECASEDVERTDKSHVNAQFQTLREKYNRIGASLLHLIQFVDINTKGILRLLRKHDKRVSTRENDLYELFVFGRNRNNTRSSPYASATMMASLQNHQSLDALCVTLQDSYTELRLLQQKYTSQQWSIAEEEPATKSTMEVERGRETKASTIMKQRCARSPKGLGRRHRSIQGLVNLLQSSLGSDGSDGHGMDDTARSFSSTMRFKTPSFALLQDRSMSYILPKEDFLMAQIYAARRSIVSQQNEVMNMLATTALGFNVDPGDNEDSIRAEYERAAALDAYKRSHAISSILNFVSSFVYMANYLIVVPTVVTYSQKLGANPALSSAIVGMTPFATIFSTIVYSWWTSYSYRIPLLVAASLNVIGNLVYAMGYPCNSMSLVLIGRLMSGLGSCRPINRRYIADAYSTAERTAASAHFVAVGCFGMALGPFLGSVLHRIAEHSTSPYWQVENAPGWFMAAVWFVYVIFHVIFFVDPPRDDVDEVSERLKQGKNATGETAPLLDKKDAALVAVEEEHSIPIWRNAAVIVNFFIYFIEKLLMECVSSSTSLLTYFYFNWPGSWAGYWLAFLCLLVLPVNLAVAYLSKIYQDREMMVVMQIATIIGCVVIMRFGEEYYVEQYLIGTLIIVVCSNMVEGPNMALLSKTIPKSWRKGFFNVGLLATEAATLGRTVGDAFLALCGSAGIEHQLNLTFGSMIIATTFTLWITYRFYDSLIPTEDKTL
jgi:hypothetical protein